MPNRIKICKVLLLVITNNHKFSVTLRAVSYSAVKGAVGHKTYLLQELMQEAVNKLIVHVHNN